MEIDKIRHWYLVAGFVGIIGLMSVIRIISSNEEAWLHYGSPITIVAAALLFILFYRLPKFHNRFINWIAASCLASFILHTCEPVFSWFVHKDVVYFSNNVYPLYCLKTGVVIAGIFAASIIFDKLRLLMFNPLITLSGKVKTLN